MNPYTFTRDIFAKSIFVRYVFSGGTAAAIDVGLLYILNAKFGIYYLVAASIALTISFFVRFFLQKFVTFKDTDSTKTAKQFGYYTIMYVGSLAATNAFLYLFVSFLHLPIILSQIIAILLIACVCYFVYNIFIFAKKPEVQSQQNNLQ